MLPTLLLWKKKGKNTTPSNVRNFYGARKFCGEFWGDVTRELCCRQCYWDSSANEQQRERMLDLTYMRHVSVGADLAYLCDIYCIIYIIMKTQMYIGIPLTWIPSIFFFFQSISTFSWKVEFGSGVRCSAVSSGTWTCIWMNRRSVVCARLTTATSICSPTRQASRICVRWWIVICRSR